MATTEEVQPTRNDVDTTETTNQLSIRDVSIMMLLAAVVTAVGHTVLTLVALVV